MGKEYSIMACIYITILRDVTRITSKNNSTF